MILLEFILLFHFYLQFNFQHNIIVYYRKTYYKDILEKYTGLNKIFNNMLIKNNVYLKKVLNNIIIVLV